MMEIPDKSSALEAIDLYEKTRNNIPTLIKDSGEPLIYWCKILGLSQPAISNKKTGRREWKPSEVKAVLAALKKDTRIVDDYMYVVANIDKMIWEKGYRKMFIYQKIGLSNIQIQQRNTSKNREYSTWDLEEVRKIVQAL